MVGFSKQFLEEIKTQLEAQKNKTEHSLAQLVKPGDTEGVPGAVFPEFGDDPDENAEEVAAYDTNLQLEETLEGELRDIKGALKRLDEDTYGICKYCQQLIDEKRLLARPTSSSCVTCKKTIVQEA